MDNLLPQPSAAQREGFEAAEPPSYGDAALHSVIPATEKEWKDVLKHNTSCLKGITVSRQAGVPEMAQYTAFEFNYDPTRGPEHVQDEMTRVTVIRIESESHQESVQSGIAQQEIELLMKTVAADSRLGVRNRNASLYQHRQSSKIKKLEVSHWHPKFVLFLDERSLAIAKDCDSQLQQLQHTDDKRQVEMFLEDYGDGFATQVIVGGRLFHSENASTLEDAALKEREKSLEAAAQAALAAKGASMKAALSSQTASSHNDHLRTISSSEELSWSGIGGDTSLHGDPRLWMLSLNGNKASWKIIEKKRLVPLPEALGKFRGYEWVPSKFQQLLRPPITAVPRLMLPGGCHIGLSSFAIYPKSRYGTISLERGNSYVAFQDEERYIRYGDICMNDDSSKNDTLFTDPLVRARENTPLALVSGWSSSISLVYVTENGFIANKILDHGSSSWRDGPLVGSKFEVAPHSNVAGCNDEGMEVICFEDPNGDLCFVYASGGRSAMDHGKTLNILPGTPLAIRSSINWRREWNRKIMTEFDVTACFLDRDGRLMSLRLDYFTEGHRFEWTLSEVFAPSVTDSLLPARPWTRSNALLSLHCSQELEYAIIPDSSGKLTFYFRCDKTGRLVRHKTPLGAAICENSRYVWLADALVFMSPDGDLRCTIIHTDGRVVKSRPIFQSRALA
ncbi:hypothetical protein BJX64DRAFT_294644 [Aspergillus heterothallicus]